MKTGHVGLNVSNLERSLAFYKEIFGLEVVRESFEKGKKFAFLGHNGAVTVTLWEQSDTTFSTSHAGLHHLAFEVDSSEAVQRMEEKIKALGVSLIYPGITAHEEGAQSGGLFFLDPDGIRLEIYTPADIASHEAHTEEGPACGFF
ncbi:VOC family protein [Paenibacillus daejeonensis]|uniref:VOC family protein n=1 Tax=Paenibacillus daejeonensis TaxID=135193 RepID=UPI0003772B72|nr:VOC family protein [Paenibacillus daejeonensis]